MGADSSEGQNQGTTAPTIEFSWPAHARDRESIADYTYVSRDGWTARGMLGYAAQGGLYLQSITVDAPPGERVTAKMLRELPLTDILAEARGTDFIVEATLAELSEPIPDAAAEAKGPGRTPLSDDLLRDVALGYLDQTAPGMGRGAVKRLAERMGVDQKTMSRYVWRARQNGWLGPALQGREGSEPGPRLLADPASARLTGRSHGQRGVGRPPRPHEVKADERDEE